MSLNIQPKVTRVWELNPEQLSKLIAAELGVSLAEVTISFNLENTEYDDRFGPTYKFAGVKVTSK